MKNSRLFKILCLLVEKRAVTAKELAERESFAVVKEAVLQRRPLSFLLSFGSQLQVLSQVYWRDILMEEIKKFEAVYEIGQTLSDFRPYPYSRGGREHSAQYKEVIDMEERKFCQCCGMPMDRPEDAGTEANGALSGDYCHYCYQSGAFTVPDAAMDDIIAFNLKFNAENGYPFGTQEEAEKMMRSWFPTLKRWRKP